MSKTHKNDPDIAASLRRFRRYGRPRLGPGEVFNYGHLDHDGQPKELWEMELGAESEGEAGTSPALRRQQVRLFL